MENGKVLFFPSITRREKYSTKANGEYYHYQHYRDEIRDDCLKRCVYCDIQEAECGGDELMELEHFRPQKHFSALTNNPHNLVYSCSGCNKLKSDHWPALGVDLALTVTDDGEGFIDPFNTNRNDYFCVLENGEIEEIKAPGKYLIVLLALNRETRKKIRQIRIEKVKVIEFLGKRIEEANTFCRQNSLNEETELFLRDHLSALATMRDNLIRCLFIDL